MTEAVSRHPGVPQVSVVVPTKDRDWLLGQTLRSIRWQQGVDFEVWVVDDGSTDSKLVERTVADVADSRFNIVRHERSRGVSAARNRGLTEARASWVAFCDDDDLWAPDKLAKQLTAARCSTADWVYVGSVNVTIGDRVVGGEPPLDPAEVAKRLEESNVIPGGSSGVMLRRTVLLDLGGFDPALQPLADWDLWLRILRVSKPACVPEPLVAYRVHATNMSLNIQRVQQDFAVLASRYPRANKAVLYRYLGWWSIRVDRHVAAARLFLQAVATRDARYPRSLFRKDLWYLARHAAERARSRLGSRVGRRPLQAPVVVEQAAWREHGQRWVDQLSTS